MPDTKQMKEKIKFGFEPCTVELDSNGEFQPTTKRGWSDAYRYFFAGDKIAFVDTDLHERIAATAKRGDVVTIQKREIRNGMERRTEWEVTKMASGSGETEQPPPPRREYEHTEPYDMPKAQASLTELRKQQETRQQDLDQARRVAEEHEAAKRRIEQHASATLRQQLDPPNWEEADARSDAAAREIRRNASQRPDPTDVRSDAARAILPNQPPAPAATFKRDAAEPGTPFLNSADILFASLKTAITAAALAEQYAQQLTYSMPSFRSEDIRAMALTVFIQRTREQR